MKPYTKAIPSTDRRKVAMINAEIIEREKKPAVIGTECGYKCLVCGMVDYYISSVHMEKHGFESRADAIRQGALVKCTVSHGAHRKGA